MKFIIDIAGKDTRSICEHFHIYGCNGCSAKDSGCVYTKAMPIREVDDKELLKLSKDELITQLAAARVRIKSLTNACSRLLKEYRREVKKSAQSI